MDDICNIESLLAEFELNETNTIIIDKSNLIKESDVPLMPFVRINSSPIYSIDINFDEASIAWRSNKRIKNKHFYYSCRYKNKDGSLCRDYTYKSYEFCQRHIKM